ncbi:MAG TPA: RNA polymerase sigma-70 factor [Balneolaceae bacterium]|nr:RNA polymerase sigma-70 factor [Balneolaceae bacterium]
MKHSEERNAVLLLRQGSSLGFRTIFHLYHKQLYFLSLKIVKDPVLAEDVVQDVFVKLWLYREKLNPDKSVKGLLTTITRNHIRNVIRDNKRKILGSYELHEADHPHSRFTEEDILWQEYKQILNKGIGNLPEKRQMIYRMKVHEGLSNREISARLNVSENTVKAHFYQANKFIKAFLRKEADITIRNQV